MFIEQRSLQVYDEVFGMMYTTDILEGGDDIKRGYNMGLQNQRGYGFPESAAKLRKHDKGWYMYTHHDILPCRRTYAMAKRMYTQQGYGFPELAARSRGHAKGWHMYTHRAIFLVVEDTCDGVENARKSKCTSLFQS